MGQKQSGPKDNSQIEAKSSYYELLNVNRDATDDEIKKAYRRKALELHPDRNYGDVERATQLFADIQSAYEVLSDPQERAWYDSHEEAILGKASTEDGHEQYERDIGLTTAEDVIAAVQNYNKNINFSDGPGGFYGFLRDFFGQLAKEEEAAAGRQGMDIPDWPSFGRKMDNPEDVKGFYSKWTGFSTCKTFEWRNYRIDKDAERSHRRYMETYNKRIRDDARNEFTQAVRQLARFVRKRDPRMPQAKSEKEVEASLRDAVAAQKARAAKVKAENDAKLAEDLPEWVKAREPDEVEELLEEESEEEHFECVACKKTFKSEKSWEAHEKSKKHIKTVQQLRRRLQKEGFDLDVNEESAPQSDAETLQDQPVETTDNDDNIADHIEKLNVKMPEPATMPESKLADSTEDEGPNNGGDEENSGFINDDDDDDDDGDDDDDDDEEEDVVVELGTEIPTAVSEHKAEATGVDAKTSKKGKAKQKREKRAAQQASTTSQTHHQCASCKASFPSRNRLFQHITDWHSGGPPARGGKGKKK